MPGVSAILLARPPINMYGTGTQISSIIRIPGPLNSCLRMNTYGFNYKLEMRILPISKRCN